MSLGWQDFLSAHPNGHDSSDTRFWEGFLDEHPDVLHRLLADVYQAAYGTQKPPTLDDLWEVVATPRFSVAPFPAALRQVLGRRSLRWLAQEIGIHHSLLQRMVAGERPIVQINDPDGSMRRLEEIAKALRIHPSYFSEWRRLWVMKVIDEAFRVHPDLSVRVYARFAGLQLNARSKGESA